jgi:hypothetical protein
MYNVPPSFLQRDMMSMDKTIFRKQSNFIRTIQGRPEWGKYIRTLRWTVLDASDQQWGSREVLFDGDGDGAIINNDDDDDGEEEQRPVYAPEDSKRPGVYLDNISYLRRTALAGLTDMYQCYQYRYFLAEVSRNTSEFTFDLV